MSENVETPSPMGLTDRQRARVERNRQRALLLRQSRLARHPYLNKEDNVRSKVIDTGGGFFLEECSEQASAVSIVHPPGPLLAPDRPHCDECQRPFDDSFLFSKFELSVCDNCRNEEKHVLITRTDAKNKYLLKDCDLDKREPLLKFIVRRNPQNDRWGDMKLYLKSQVFERSMEVWGSEEAIEMEKNQRAGKREISRQKKFDKKVKELRMTVRSSLYNKTTKTHEHNYGPESYNADEDTYSMQCKTCDYIQTYEKM